MAPEMRSRGKEVLAQLKNETLHPSRPDQPVWTSYASKAELTIMQGIEKLAALGDPVREIVQAEAKTAQGDYLPVLNMALARLGDKTKINAVANWLTTSQNPTIRFCAAMTLRKLRDPAAVPALTKALHDPYQRVDGSDVGPRTKIYPVRIVAADALVELGKNPKEVRATMQH
jgi:HEAT repeat protein